MIPYFITLYTYHVCCKNVTTWLTPLKCPRPSSSYSKYVHFSWACHLNINRRRSATHKHTHTHTHTHTHDYLLSFNHPPEELSWWHNIRSSKTRSRYVRLSLPQISWWRHTAGAHRPLSFSFSHTHTHTHTPTWADFWDRYREQSGHSSKYPRSRTSEKQTMTSGCCSVAKTVIWGQAKKRNK